MPEAKLFMEKRRHARIPVQIPIRYRLLEDKKEIKHIYGLGKTEKVAKTVDTSLGGMYIVADQALNVEGILSLKIALPERTEVISAFAEVVWSNEKGAGLRFLAIKEQDINALAEHLKTVSFEGGSGHPKK